MVIPLSIMAGDNNGQRVHLKVLGGVSYSTLTGEHGVFGPTAGGQFDIRVSSQPVYVIAGIEYLNRGYKGNSNHSFIVPFLGSYHIQLGKYVTVQPFAGTIISYGFNWKNWDSGLRLGCCFNCNRWNFSVGYDLGFRHYKFIHAEGRNNTLFINLGYNFNFAIN